jgi:hypothetical protein
MAYTFAGSAQSDIVPRAGWGSTTGLLTVNNYDRTARQAVNIDITGDLIVVDIRSVETGFVNFAKGAAPDYRLVPLGSSDLPERPGKDFTPCVRVQLFHDEHGLRDLTVTAVSARREFEQAIISWLECDQAQKGLVPRTSIRPGEITGSTTLVYPPVFSPAAWVPRPDIFGEPTVALPEMDAIPF